MEDENKIENPVETKPEEAKEDREPKVVLDESGYEDKVLVCQDCGKEFVWTAGAQAFFAEKHFQAPKRCKECTIKNKQRIHDWRAAHAKAPVADASVADAPAAVEIDNKIA